MEGIKNPESRMMIILIVSIITGIYFLWLLLLAIAWMRHTTKKVSGHPAHTPVTILVPCRNEEKNIMTCLQSIFEQDYPSNLVAVFVIDDHSEDRTAELVAQDGRAKLLRLPAGLRGKKTAIDLGVQEAKTEVIITRDADTVSGKHWLQTIADQYNTSNPDLLISPVSLRPGRSVLNVLERLEHFALTIITSGTAMIGKPILCNGANLVFKKSTFQKVNGYSGNEHIPSGDDVFLLNKIATLDKRDIIYLKDREATVYTETNDSWAGMIRQRLRWASKNKQNNNGWNSFTGILIFFTSLSWLFMAVWSFFYSPWTGYFAFPAIIKCIIDFLLLFLGSTFHRQVKTLIAFPLMVLLYPVYIVLITIGSLVIKPEWKGRKTE